MKKLKLLKEDVLQRKGDSNSKVFLVEQGLLYAYIIDEKGKEHIFMFAPKGWIVADISLIPNKSELYIEAIEDALEVKSEKELLPLQPGDVPDTYADVDDLVEQFGYKPSMSIKQGVENFAEWYKEYNE